jgi:hypothetical protein
MIGNFSFVIFLLHEDQPVEHLHPFEWKMQKRRKQAEEMRRVFEFPLAFTLKEMSRMYQLWVCWEVDKLPSYMLCNNMYEGTKIY